MNATEQLATSPSGLRVVTEPRKRIVVPDLKEVWAYRDLIYFLIKRDIAVTYKQTAFGIGWVILRPIIPAVMYWFLFGVVLEVPSDGVPFAAFVIAGLTLWLFFTTAVTAAASSALASTALFTQVYFPRLVIPFAAVIPPLVDFGLGFVVLEIILLVMGITPQPGMIFVPVVVGIMLLLATGAGLFLSALTARFRDVELGVAYLLQGLLFASAVIYPLSILPEKAQEIFAFNPLVGVMETFRQAVLPTSTAWDPTVLIPSVVIGIILLVGGLFYYSRVEQTLADVI